MLQPRCRVDGCPKPGGTYHPYCEYHKRAYRRHGHPQQRGVTGEELKPYLKRVRDRVKKNPSSTAWTALRDRWEFIVDVALQYERGIELGNPFQRNARESHDCIRRVARDVTPMQVTEVALAVYLMREDQPHRFKSDAAFDYQLARRVRGLTASNAASYFDHATQKVKRVYRDMAPRTLEGIARALKETFGVAGTYIGKLEQREIEAYVQKRIDMRLALEELQ